MTRTFHRLTSVAALLAAFHTARAADAPDTFSPVVSYQFEDSLAESDTQTPIISPVVAYQYYDWPGDENLTFQNSPAVSYFYYFSGGLTLIGTVTTPTGAPVPGAQITFKRVNAPFSLATSNANGVYTAPGLATPANYTLTVTKPGFVTKITNLAFTGAGNQAFDFQLTPLPAAPTTVAVNRNVATTAVRPPLDPTDPDYPILQSWNGTQWGSLSGLRMDRPTVVICHGWVPTKVSDSYATALDWTRTLAYLIAHNHPGLSDAPNILVWDWRKKAHTALPQVDDAAAEGLELGKALVQALGPNYSKHVHFIGHSLGTIVNANACDYVHGVFPRTSMRPTQPWSAALTTPHVTLLDEAEIATLLGRQVITAAAVAWEVAQFEGALLASGIVAVKDWKNPVPNSARWSDNYISAFGLRHGTVVNVSLLAPTLALHAQTLSSLLDSAVTAHGYSYQWYENSITSPGAPVGYASSLEGGGSFPPSGAGTALGTLWWENTDTSNPFDLSGTRPNLGGIVDFAFRGDAPFLLALAGGGGATALGGSVLSGYEQGIQWAGNIGGTVIYSTGQVTSQAVQKVGLWWDAAQDAAADVLNSVNPDQLLAGPLAAPVFGITLGTAPAARPNSGRNPALAAAGTPGQPAAAWVTVNVPPDAGMMAFDFTVTGDPVEDTLAFAINDQNVFSLPAKFAPDGQTVSTDMMDVSAYAGQNVELFFGLVGGTSTNCQVAVDGIRFITVPPPRVAISSVAGKAVIQWPAAATGWILETSDNLVTSSWQTVPTDSGVTVSDGVLTLEQPMTDQKRFYRLRRGP